MGNISFFYVFVIDMFIVIIMMFLMVVLFLEFKWIYGDVFCKVIGVLIMLFLCMGLFVFCLVLLYCCWVVFCLNEEFEFMVRK